MEKVLFVCLGNICRSPAGEGILKKILKDRGLSDKFHVDSAGIGDWHVGSLPDIRMRRHGSERGYSFDSRARQFVVADFDEFDYIFVMDNANYQALKSMSRSGADMDKVYRTGNFIKHHPKNNYVPDPYYGGDGDFELAIDLLEDACGAIASYISRNKTTDE